MEKEVIKFLKNECSNGFKFEEVDKENLLVDLMENIGIKDPNIRDRLIYPCLAHLLHDNHFDKDKLTAITKQMISDDFLFFDISNSILYSVLKRSFVLLQLVILLYVHKRDDIFNKDFVFEIVEKFLRYFEAEWFLEGYNEDVGWMHSIAHSADVFGQVFNLEELTPQIAEKSLILIKEKMVTSTYNFINDEDERMTTAIVRLLDRGLVSKEFLLSWVESFSEFELIKEYPSLYNLKNNRKNLLRSIYFRIIDSPDYSYLLDPLKNQILKNQDIK